MRVSRRCRGRCRRRRGRLPFQVGGNPVHATPGYPRTGVGYPAFCHERGVILAQEPIERGEEKSEAELTVVPALVAGEPRTGVAWLGRVLTGDALFYQRKLCDQVLAAGADFLVLVKEHQTTLLVATSLLFDPPAALGPAALVASFGLAFGSGATAASIRPTPEYRPQWVGYPPDICPLRGCPDRSRRSLAFRG